MRPQPILFNDFCFTGLWFGRFATLIVLRDKAGDPALLVRNSAVLAGIKKGLLKITHTLPGSLRLSGAGKVIAWAR